MTPDRQVAHAAAPIRYFDHALLFLGLFTAAAMRPTIWPLIVAAFLAAVVAAVRRRNWATLALALVLVAAVFAAALFANRFGSTYFQYARDQITTGSLARTVARNLRDLFAVAASDVLFQTRFGPVFNSALSVVVLALGFTLFRHRLLWGFWFCLLLVTILMAQETLDRYFLPVLPLLVFAWWDALVRLYRRVPRPAADVAFLGLLAFGSIVNLTKVGGIIAQQRSRPFLATFDNGTFEVVPRFADAVRDRVDENAVVLAPAPYGRVRAYLARRTVQSAADVTVPQTRRQKIYVVEPADPAIHQLLTKAGLTEDPAVYTATPAAGGKLAVALSLHPTRRK